VPAYTHGQEPGRSGRAVQGSAPKNRVDSQREAGRDNNGQHVNRKVS
jgi:hypothetical protein